MRVEKGKTQRDKKKYIFFFLKTQSISKKFTEQAYYYECT